MSHQLGFKSSTRLGLERKKACNIHSKSSSESIMLKSESENKDKNMAPVTPQIVVDIALRGDDSRKWLNEPKIVNGFWIRGEEEYFLWRRPVYIQPNT